MSNELIVLCHPKTAAEFQLIKATLDANNIPMVSGGEFDPLDKFLNLNEGLKTIKVHPRDLDRARELLAST